MKLLDCPFCGGPARLFQKYRDPKPRNWRVCCDNESPDRGSLCWMENPYADFESEAEAIAAWNRRAPMTALTPAAEEGESCPLCGALPIDQVDSHAVEQHVRNRYKFSRQGLLDDCASREAAQRIVEWADNGKLADDEWLVERNETAIIAICRALLSSPRVEEVRREAFEEAAKVADEMAGNLKHLSATIYPDVQIGSHLETCKTIAKSIRSLSPQGPNK